MHRRVPTSTPGRISTAVKQAGEVAAARVTAPPRHKACHRSKGHRQGIDLARVGTPTSKHHGIYIVEADGHRFIVPPGKRARAVGRFVYGASVMPMTHSQRQSVHQGLAQLGLVDNASCRHVSLLAQGQASLRPPPKRSRRSLPLLASVSASPSGRKPSFTPSHASLNCAFAKARSPGRSRVAVLTGDNSMTPRIPRR